MLDYKKLGLIVRFDLYYSIIISSKSSVLPFHSDSRSIVLLSYTNRKYFNLHV